MHKASDWLPVGSILHGEDLIWEDGKGRYWLVRNLKGGFCMPAADGSRFCFKGDMTALQVNQAGVVIGKQTYRQRLLRQRVVPMKKALPPSPLEQRLSKETIEQLKLIAA